MRLKLAPIVAVLALSCACDRTDSGAAQQGSDTGATPRSVIRVSAVPDENPSELQRKYEPLVEHLSKALGTEVVYVPVTDYGGAVQALAAGKVDFAWLGAFTHVQSRHLADVEPICMRAIDREFESVFIANKESGISSMSDLGGKTFAFGSKSSTSGHLMPRHFLTAEHQINPDRDFDGAPVFSGSHDATIKMVELGKVQAGVANSLVWQRMVRENQVDEDKVAVVWTTPGYVDYVWTARKAVDPLIRSKFEQAFVSLDSHEPADAIILALQNAQSFVPASPKDFDAVEQVALSTGLLKPKSVR